MKKDNEKYHYFAFSFSDVKGVGSVYLGFPEQLVSVKRINIAKEQALMPAHSVLIGLGYMGHMTADEAANFDGQHDSSASTFVAADKPV
jgi:hypothetical protein